MPKIHHLRHPIYPQILAILYLKYIWTPVCTVWWGCHSRVPQTRWLNQENYFLTILGARSPGRRCQQMGSILSFSWACGWPPPLFLHVVFPPCLLSLTLSHFKESATLVLSAASISLHFNLTPSISPDSTYHHILRSWRLGFPHMNLWYTVYPIKHPFLSICTDAITDQPATVPHMSCSTFLACHLMASLMYCPHSSQRGIF